jgi:N-acetylglucosaminyldiphosphoundecaprenol N-acetyl-beta-D-mannosaminyltransferase
LTPRKSTNVGESSDVAEMSSIGDERGSLAVLGTSLQVTTYSKFTAELQRLVRASQVVTVDFSNTQIVTLRRHDPGFREITSRVEYFIPDGMPLIWCLNFQGAGLHDRVYGPTFMRHCILNSPAPYTHYFLGGSDECVGKLVSFFQSNNPLVKIIGTRNGYFDASQEQSIIDEINRLSPDFIWIGLGTPKQQSWIHRCRDRINRGVLLAVGFAFDVNAGTKPDAPLLMQRLGLTWVFRIISEPRRLGLRYLKFNFLFLYYLLRDGARGRAWTPGFSQDTQGS